MNENTIHFYHRKKQQVLEEKPPQKKLLQFLYKRDQFTSKISRNVIAKLPIVSRLIGLWMKMPWTKKSIQKFIADHDIDMDQCKKQTFSSFNDFFIRELKPQSRPIDVHDIISPCDGRYLFINQIDKETSFYAKGQTLSLSSLIENQPLANIFDDGTMIISRLAPPDYHRFHVPTACTLINKYESKKSHLFSVSPIALRNKINYLLENKKVILHMHSQEYGNFLMIVIGATSIGSIHFLEEKKQFDKGECLGYFSFGGSMVITIFEKNQITICPSLLSYSARQLEVFLQMGEKFTI